MPETVEQIPELLPCPFCGGPAEWTDPIVMGEGGEVRCKGDCRDLAFTGFHYGAKDLVIAAWNRRPSSEAGKGEALPTVERFVSGDSHYMCFKNYPRGAWSLEIPKDVQDFFEEWATRYTAPQAEGVSEDKAVEIFWAAYVEDQATPGDGLVPDPQDNIRAGVRALLKSLARPVDKGEGTAE